MLTMYSSIISMKSQVKRLPSGYKGFAVIVFNGEGDLRHMGLPEAPNIVIELTTLPEMIVLSNNRKAYRERGNDMHLDEGMIIRAMHAGAVGSLLELYQQVVPFGYTKSKEKTPHIAVSDAEMTLELFLRAWSFRQHHAELFDRYSTLHLSKEAYMILLEKKCMDLLQEPYHVGDKVLQLLRSMMKELFCSKFMRCPHAETFWQVQGGWNLEDVQSDKPWK